MVNKLDALDKSIPVELMDAQEAKLRKNTSTKNIGLPHMKQLQGMLSSNGADADRFTCAFDSQTPWGFSIKKIVPSDSSFHQKVMTRDEKAETYFGFMSIFDNQNIAGNPKLDDITMEELTSTLLTLKNKIMVGEYITGADLRPIVSLIVEDLSSPPLPQPSTSADFAHIDLKEMKALKNLLEAAKSSDEVVTIRSEPQAAPKVAIELHKPDTNTTGISFLLLNDLKRSIERRSINQTVTTLKSMLSKWETDRRISDDTKNKIDLIKKLFDSKEARGVSITVADLHGTITSITRDLKQYKTKSRH